MPFTNRYFYGYLDQFGVFHQTDDGYWQKNAPESAPIQIRYDRWSEEPWCCKHNCRLAQCKELH